MALSTEERARLEAEREELEEQVYEQSVNEVLILTSFLKTYHWLSTFNQKNELSPSESGGIRLSKDILKQVGFGFTKATPTRKPVFLIHLQPHEYQLLSSLSPQGAWLESDGVCMMFQAVKYADYLVPPLMISFKIASPVIYEKLFNECDFMTLCLISESELTESAFDVREVYNPVIPLLKSIPNKAVATSAFAKAFY